MENFTDLYLEMGEMVAVKMPRIQWVDLWHNQINFLEDELPFPTPAVFFQFFLLRASDMGELQQQCQWQVDIYLFYETMADTSRGSMNRDSAFEFLSLLNELHVTFHGASGESFTGMRRIGLRAQDTGNIGNLYTISFTCETVDNSAQKAYNDSTLSGVDIVNEKGPEPEPLNDFIIS